MSASPRPVFVHRGLQQIVLLHAQDAIDAVGHDNAAGGNGGHECFDMRGLEGDFGVADLAFPDELVQHILLLGQLIGERFDLGESLLVDVADLLDRGPS
jgi:hypothetical protein